MPMQWLIRTHANTKFAHNMSPQNDSEKLQVIKSIANLHRGEIRETYGTQRKPRPTESDRRTAQAYRHLFSETITSQNAFKSSGALVRDAEEATPLVKEEPYDETNIEEVHLILKPSSTSQ